MTKNPILNALSAVIYIVAIASIMFYGGKVASGPDNSILAPIAVISLFTLSAAVMGFLFFYQPIQLFLENKKKKAVNLFLQTVGIFGLITALLLVLLFSGVLS